MKFKKAYFQLIGLFFISLSTLSQNDFIEIYIDKYSNQIFFDSTSFEIHKSLNLKDGNYIFYNKETTKQVICILSILNSKKNGVQTIFQNRNIKSITNYNNGLYDGKEIIYFRNGNLKEETVYNKSNIISKTTYYETGNLKSTFLKEGSIYVEKSYFLSNKVERIDIISELKAILSTTTFCENGERIVHYRNTYNSTTFPFLSLYCNGKTHVKGTCVGNVLCLIGNYEVFYENGNKQLKGQYLNNPKNPNIQIGNWLYYNESGNLTKQEEYSKTGELLKIINTK